jgi:membrane protease subunit (stomatin/prohibitin family)
MRGRFTTVMGLTLGCFATTVLASECQDTLQQNKSQQNSADEAAVRGDLKAGSECATPADKALSEKKNEDAAEQAKKKIDAPAGTPGQGK